jgi:hypothetical protein
MIKANKILITLSLIMALTLSTWPARANIVDTASPPPPERIETRVYVRKQCLLSEPQRKVQPAQPQALGALAAIFVPLLIEKALGGVSSALRKAGAPETLRDSGKLPTYLYQLSRSGEVRKLALNSDLGCVIMVRGTFSGPDPEVAPMRTFHDVGVFRGDTEADEDKRVRRLNQNQIPVVTIAAIYEAAIIVSNDNSAFHYEGRFLQVRSFQGSRSAQNRAMVLSFGIYGPGSKEGEPLLSLALQNLGEVAKGTIDGPNQLRNKRTSWLGGIGMIESAVTSLQKLQVPDGKTVGVMPVTIEGTFVETDDGNKALVFIADILDAKKEALTKLASEEILDGSKRDKAEADALETLTQEEETAYAKYLEKQTDLAGLAPPAANATATQIAKYNAERSMKEFEVKRTLRLWCIKFRALKTIGSPTIAQRPAADCN